MTKRLISSGSTFEEQIGYSRAVVVGDWVFVSGTTGYDYQTMCIRIEPQGRRSRHLCPAQQNRFRDVLAGAAQILRGRAPGGDDDFRRPCGPAHED